MLKDDGSFFRSEIDLMTFLVKFTLKRCYQLSRLPPDVLLAVVCKPIIIIPERLKTNHFHQLVYSVHWKYFVFSPLNVERFHPGSC